ncbi:MAG: hypothetical protein HZB91_09770 [Elusimicrobia bacterium]|nr:hypothetical protein [Elusimicrobiota bacterium]
MAPQETMLKTRLEETDEVDFIVPLPSPGRFAAVGAGVGGGILVTGQALEHHADQRVLKIPAHLFLAVLPAGPEMR